MRSRGAGLLVWHRVVLVASLTDLLAESLLMNSSMAVVWIDNFLYYTLGLVNLYRKNLVMSAT
jgi:hypothetical protein